MCKCGLYGSKTAACNKIKKIRRIANEGANCEKGWNDTGLR